MEAANRGAFEAGAKSIGFNINLPMEQFPNSYITSDLCFLFRYFALRKMHFLRRTKALVAFPGGFGTLDELFDALTLIQTRTIDAMPVVLVGQKFWRGVFDIAFLADEGVIDREDIELCTYVETADEAWKQIEAWYRKRGLDLMAPPSEGRFDRPNVPELGGPPALVGQSASSARDDQRGTSGMTMKKPQGSKSTTVRRTSSEAVREYRYDYSKSKANCFARRVGKDAVVVVLDPDVAEVFQDRKRVNALLRAAIASVKRIH